MHITLIITIITVAISILAMYNEPLMDIMIFNPYTVQRKNQWYRFISSGFIHADFMHLAFNMFSFYNPPFKLAFSSYLLLFLDLFLAPFI